MRNWKQFPSLESLAIPLAICLQMLASNVMAEGRNTPITISKQPQLFLDDHVVSKIQNLKRVLQQPVKHAANPLVVQEFPWEKRCIEVYGTVLYEPELGKFRMWYLASEHPDAKPEYYMCLAESRDGIRWTKPLIGPVKIQAHAKHNIVIPGGHGMCVIRTADDPSPNKNIAAWGGVILLFLQTASTGK